MKIIEKHFDIVTQEETIIERDETAAETKARLDNAKAYELLKAEAEEKELEKSAVLAKIGLTAEEAQILLS